ncbi:MAG: hypothetical protein ABIX01_05860 [Chitinophagaceae bacterium]
MKQKFPWSAFIVLILAASCKEKNIELTSPALDEYWKPTVGKYIVYRIDSTVSTNFGVSLTVHSYRVKDLVDAEVVDGLGRKAYRILRSITDTNGVDAYKPNASFYAVPVGTEWIELVDNNLRFMKLRWPIRDGFEWKAHSFIDATSINSTVRYLADWNYAYQNIAQPYTVLTKKFDNTVTVMQKDETIPEGPFSPAAYKQRNYGVEVYAKGIGLIYKDFLHYIYQPPTPTRAGYYEDESFGIRLRVIEYN